MDAPVKRPHWLTPPRSDSLTSAALWRPWGWAARALGLVFVASQVFLALGDSANEVPLWVDVLALVTLALALALLALPVDDPYPRPLAIAVATLAVAITAIEVLGVHSSETLYSNWHLGASVFVLMVLTFRAPISLVWLAFAAVVALELGSVAAQNQPIAAGSFELARHAASIAIAWVVAIGIRRSAERLRVLAVQRAEREADATVRREIMRAQASELTRIDETAGALLRRLSTGGTLTEAEREESLLVEASLRDAMSGRGLATQGVLAAARAARGRGVRVVLLDDSKGQNPYRFSAASYLERVLNGLDGGSCTARLLPAGRDRVLSVTIDDETGGRLVELTAEEVGTL